MKGDCSCGCCEKPRPRLGDYGSIGRANPEEGVGDPLVGRAYSSPLTMQRFAPPDSRAPSDALAPSVPAVVMPTVEHAPTDRVAPISVHSVYQMGAQIVDSAMPTRVPVHNYGYSVIADQEVSPLSYVGYSFAAVDTEGLLAEAQYEAEREAYG